VLRPYQRAFVSALGAGPSSASYRFVPKVNEPLAPQRMSGLIEVADRATQRARITRLRHQLLERLALDRTKRSRPSAQPPEGQPGRRRDHAVPTHIGIVFATVARWRLPVRATCRAHPRRGRNTARQAAPAPSTATAA
jgi:hypothetical protein